MSAFDAIGQMGNEIFILMVEAMALYGTVLAAHSLRDRFGTAFFYALVGGLTAIMSWTTDARVAVSVGDITFVVGSVVFYTSLLLSVFVVYVFDGPRTTRIAISTVLFVSILAPVIAGMLHMLMGNMGVAEIARVPMPDFRINAASAGATMIDLVFLAVAWEFLGKSGVMKLWLRTYATLLGVMWLDVVLFAPGAFAGTPEFSSIMKGTLISRFLVSLLAFPFLYIYLHWQNRKKGIEIEKRPVLAILKRVEEVESELADVRKEMERRKWAEESLRKSEAQLEAKVAERTRQLCQAKKQWENTFDAMSDWVAIIDQDHRIVRSNNAIMDMFGLTPAQAVGKRCHHVVHKSDGPFSGCPLAKATGGTLRETMEFQTDEGRWLEVLVDPMEKSDDNVLFVHIVRDITDLKNRESEVLTARKAEAFRILSGGIAHDYNNLLSIIWGNISLLREDIGDAGVQVFFDAAEKACDQARSLTYKFITLSQGAFLEKSSQEIGALLKMVLENAIRKDRIEISIVVPESIPPIEVDVCLACVALQNIVENAVESMGPGGKLEIRAEKAPSDRKWNGSTGGQDLRLTFKDCGRGIPENDLPKVFDPYFTTKEWGGRRGMGLGLAVTRSILLQHGGNIQIDSAPGQGTTVLATLPFADSVEADISEEKLPDCRGGSTILAMEDDPGIRKLCERMLKRLNFEVIIASHGQEAIEKYKSAVKQSVEIDLLLLDYNIKGGLGGAETLKRLKELGYRNQSIMVTGSPGSPQMMDYRKLGFDHLLLKPYNHHDLKEAVGRFISHRKQRQSDSEILS